MTARYRRYRRPLPSKLKGFNVSPSSADLDADVAAGGGWTAFYRDWDATWPFVTRQVDLARSAGANAIRLIGDVRSVANGITTRSDYLARVGQVINYCLSNGLYFYATAGGPPHYNCTAAELIAEATAYAGFVSGFPNVIACDVMQEAWAGVIASMSEGGPSTPGAIAGPITPAAMSALMGQLVASIRGVAPYLPLTFSAFDYGSTDPFTDPVHFADIWPHCDFVDVHDYATDTTADSLDAIRAALPEVQYVSGEFGDDQHNGTAHRTATVTAELTNIARADVAGGLLWAAINELDGANYYGAFLGDGTPQADVLTPYATLAGTPAFVPLSRPKP